MSKPKKVVYLFGTGATHAEKIVECYITRKDLIRETERLNGEKGDVKAGYLTNNEVSLRVIRKLQEKKSSLISKYGFDKRCLERPFDVKKDVDIELLITLLESKKNEDSKKDAEILRKYYKEDILNQLNVGGEIITPRLYSSLLEWHELNEHNEVILGFLTLNYDSLFEKALADKKYLPDYGLSIEMSPEKNNDTKRLLLKLHGSFDWYYNPESKKIQIGNDEGQEIEPDWIPPGLTKEYCTYPYNLLFGKAREILAECEILRIVGCSLSPNDLGIISLIFRAQKLKSNCCSIEIINSPEDYNKLEERLGFMLKFEPSFYDSSKYKEYELRPTKNSFLDWLFFISKDISNKGLSNTTYLKKLKSWMSQ